VNESEFIEVYFRQPVRPNLAVFLFLGYRKGNKVLMLGNKLVGMIIHRDDWNDLRKIAEKYGVYIENDKGGEEKWKLR